MLICIVSLQGIENSICQKAPWNLFPVSFHHPPPLVAIFYLFLVDQMLIYFIIPMLYVFSR